MNMISKRTIILIENYIYKTSDGEMKGGNFCG